MLKRMNDDWVLCSSICERPLAHEHWKTSTGRRGDDEGDATKGGVKRETTEKERWSKRLTTYDDQRGASCISAYAPARHT